jgi:pyruvate kinase
VALVDEKAKMLHAAVVLANELPNSRIVTFTRYGFMAQSLASLRPLRAPILAFTPYLELQRQLRLLRGVEPYVMPFAAEPDANIENAFALLRRAGHIAAGDKLIIATDILAQDRLIDAVQLRTVRGA